MASSLLSVTRVLGNTAGVSALGALWAVRTAFHGGALLPGGATTATAQAQVAGLTDMLHGGLAMVVLAFLLNLWGFWRERRGVQTSDALQVGQT